MTEGISWPLNPSMCPNCNLDTLPKLPFCARCHYDLRHGADGKFNNQCIYCQRKKALTGEHLFPNWLQKYYPLRYQRRVHRLTRPEEYFEETKPFHHEYKKFDSGDPYQIKVHNVCADCNNGWMGKLQSEAKELIKDLADGRWRHYSQQECFVLARWTAMASINFECYGRILAATQNQRTQLMNGGVPDGWRPFVSLMRSTSSAGMSFYRPMAFQLDESHEAIRIQSTFFCIERAAFYTLSAISNDALSSFLSQWVPNLQIPMCPVWPTYISVLRHGHTFLGAEDLIKLQQTFAGGRWLSH